MVKVILTDTVPLKFQGYGSSGFNSFSRGDYTAADSESKADISFSNNCDNSYRNTHIYKYYISYSTERAFLSS